MKKIITLVKNIFPFVGLISGLFGIVLFIIMLSEHQRLPYFYYSYGVIQRDFANPLLSTFFQFFLITSLIFVFLPILLMVFGSILKRKVDDYGSTSNAIPLLIMGAGILLIIFNALIVPANLPTERSLLKNDEEYTKYEISRRLFNAEKNIPITNDYVKSILNQLPSESPYKEYSVDTPLEKQKALVKELDKWWRENKNYAVWDEKTNKFKMDKEAKAAGIWTDEYRKTHPWPK